MLAHFNNIAPARNNDEPIYANLFEITFEFPEILGLSADDEKLLMISAQNIDINTTPELGVAKQSFKYSGRLYLTTPTVDQTTIESLKIKFVINVDGDSYAMNTWNYLKRLYDLGWSSATGSMSLKKNLVIPSIVAHIHNREGKVIRRLEYNNCMLRGISGQSYSYDNTGLIDTEATFTCDYWYDLYVDVQ